MVGKYFVPLIYLEEIIIFQFFLKYNNNDNKNILYFFSSHLETIFPCQPYCSSTWGKEEYFILYSSHLETIFPCQPYCLLFIYLGEGRIFYTLFLSSGNNFSLSALLFFYLGEGRILLCFFEKKHFLRKRLHVLQASLLTTMKVIGLLILVQLESAYPNMTATACAFVVFCVM